MALSCIDTATGIGSGTTTRIVTNCVCLREKGIGIRIATVIGLIGITDQAAPG